MKKIIMLISTLCIAFTSNATLISLSLDQTEYNVGDVATASIIISDIEQEFGFQKLLAFFELDANYDDSKLSFNSATFGDKLDVDALLPSDRIIDDSVAGALYLSELTFALGADLFLAQNGLSSFEIATVSFDVLATGTSELSLNNILLGTDLGTSFTDVTSENTMINVASTSVPVPATFMLFMLAGAGLLIQKRK